jgi:putative DNA primase/helicase
VGDGFKLIMCALGVDFAEAARQVDKIVGNIEAEPFRQTVDLDRRRQSLNDTWQHAKSPTIVTNYLKGRSIPTEIIAQARDLRGHKNLRHIDNEKNHTYRQAMVALIRNSKGEPISIHRTYIGILPKEKKIMPPLEKITGGCVRLGEPDETLVLAEGIETALAAWSITGHPAWATISAHGLAEMKSIPRHVKRVIVAADNDESFTGQAAAFECAKYMKNRLSVETVVTMPRHLGYDMLDVLNRLCEDNLYIKGGHEDQIGLLRWAP